MDFVDADLLKALELSANEHSSRANQPLQLPLSGANTGTPFDRSSLTISTQFHFPSHSTSSAGFILTRGSLNQFHQDYIPLIKKYGTAAAICGYTTIANLKLMSQVALPEKEIYSLADLETLIQATRNKSNVFAQVEEAMQFISQDRNNYINSHPSQFTIQSAKQYMQAWVANYEISKCLIATTNETNKNIHFLRHNQYPELRTATFEEKDIIAVEEKKFGGTSNQHGQLNFEPGASMFCVERFVPERKLQTPNDWRIEEKITPNSSLKFFALDLNGHFTACIACKTEELGNTLVLLNTTETNYSTKISFAWLFDLVFSTEKEDSRGVHTVKTCANGHGLVRFKTTHGRFSCDVCSISVPTESDVYGCRICDYDMCISCEGKSVGEIKNNDKEEDETALRVRL